MKEIIAIISFLSLQGTHAIHRISCNEKRKLCQPLSMISIRGGIEISPSDEASEDENLLPGGYLGDNYETLSNFHMTKPLLRGEFHRLGALLYPPLLGIPLFLRAIPGYKKSTLIFSLAVEGIMIVSAMLHTFPWRNEKPFQNARKADFAMIFIGIALLYSSMVKLLLGSANIWCFIEPLVWTCAVIGVLTKYFVPNAPKWLNAGAFLTQGWALLPLLPTLFRTASVSEAAGLLTGGAFITLGAAAYIFHWPNGRYREVFGPHEMFHVGTLLMFVSFWFTMWVRVGVAPL